MNGNWIIKRASLLIVVYIVLYGTVHLINFQKIHHNYFIVKNNFLFSEYNNGGRVNFYNVPKVHTNRYFEYDVLIKLSSKQQRESAIKKARKAGKTKITYEPVQYDINSWSVYGLLYIFLVAFAIVLPLAWKNKIHTFLISFALLELFFALKMWVLLKLKFSIWYDKFEVGWNNDFIIDFLNYVLIIITYPFFGMLFITVVYALINHKKLEQYLQFNHPKIVNGR